VSGLPAQARMSVPPPRKSIPPASAGARKGETRPGETRPRLREEGKAEAEEAKVLYLQNAVINFIFSNERNRV
jgi:hypothetical protein